MYLLMKYTTLTPKMRNYGQVVLVEEGVTVKLIVINEVELYTL
jgi:hypothetical protein